MLESKPWFHLTGFAHSLGAREAVVGAGRGPVVVVDFAQDQNVWQLVEGIGENANGLWSVLPLHDTYITKS